MTSGPRRRTPTAAQRAQWSDERQAKLADLHTRIVEKVATLTDGEQWRAWLTFAEKFHTYSFGNTIAIWMQRPDATWVAGIRRWNQLGRRVRHGERGISILAPVTAKTTAEVEGTRPEPGTGPASRGPAGPPGVIDVTGANAAAFVEASSSQIDGGPTEAARRVLRGFRIATVFDIGQTEGPDIDPPARPANADVEARLLSGTAPAGLWDALADIAAGRGYRIERGDCGGPNGFIRWADRLIKVRDDVDDAQAVKTLIHELGHMLLHEPADFASGSTGRCRGVQEVEAESVAFLVAAHLGLDTSDYSFGYVTTWAQRAVELTHQAPHEIVQATGIRVVRAAATLTATVDAALGRSDPPVPDELAQRVTVGGRTATQLHQATEAGLGSAAQTGVLEPPSSAARAFPTPASGAGMTSAHSAPPPVNATRRRRHR
jgi:antirestriction protein ArdC